MKSSSILSLGRGAFASILLAAAAAMAADINGTWSWTTPGRNGGADRVTKLSLKTEGDRLTGKVVAPGRDGAEVETPISDGKLEGDSVSFAVVRKTPNGENKTHYHGKISGDKISGKVELERNGEKQSRDWEAKRASK